MLKLLGFVLFLGACSHHSKKNEIPPMDKTPQIVTKSVTESTSPGQLKLIQLESLLGESVECDGKKISHYREGRFFYFFWAESYFSKTKSRECELIGGDGIYQKILIEITEKDYPAEELRVNPRRVSVNKVDQTRARQERKELDMIYAQSDTKPLFQEPFSKPLDSFITSHYGKKRIFNNVRKSQHLGVDLRARTGTPIPVSNDGSVVFAGELFYSGNTVVVDHGLGIFTTYGHLSKILVKVGDTISKKQFLGLAGKTGRVTGPHLHWGLKIHGHWVDAMSLVEETQSINWKQSQNESI